MIYRVNLFRLKKHAWKPLFLGFSTIVSFVLCLDTANQIFSEAENLRSLYFHLKDLSSVASQNELLNYLNALMQNYKTISNKHLNLLLLFHIFLFSGQIFLLRDTLAKKPKISSSPSKEPVSIQKEKEINKTHEDVIPLPENDSSLKQTIKNLKLLSDAISTVIEKQNPAISSAPPPQIHKRIEGITETGQIICNEVHNINHSLAKANTRLQRLAKQCRDSANFSATTKLSWGRNLVINNLRQVKESHDKVQNIANRLQSLHQAKNRILKEIMGIDSIFKDRLNKATTLLQQTQNAAKPGFKELHKMISSLGDSKSKLTQACTIIGNLEQRSEAASAMIQIQEELTTQINEQGLKISIEAAKLGSSGEKFVEIAEKLSKLTSHSSVSSNSVAELLRATQEEISKANAHLQQSNSAMEESFNLVSPCGDSYRQSVADSKYAQSELNLLDSELLIHLNKLNDISKLSDDASEVCNQLSEVLQEDEKITSKINDESNKLASHTDRLTQLLAHQYHELNHCEVILLETRKHTSELEKQVSENRHSTLGLKAAFEERNTTKESPINIKHLVILQRSTKALEKLHDFPPPKDTLVTFENRAQKPVNS